ncbi:MAG: hypothetical protein H6605_00305 [Flavobacteriales bacterium]|nr:hypothetical protein [Flavobacteriales bacterium]
MSGRKIMTILMAVLFTTQLFLPVVVGTMIYFVKIKQRSFIEKHAGEENLFVRIKLSSQEYRNIKFTKNEFEYKGFLYDLHKVEKIKDGVVLTALIDKVEKSLKQLSESNTGRSSLNMEKVLNTTYKLKWYFNEKQSILNQPFFIRIEFKGLIDKNNDDPYLEIPSPPPDVFS